jgi:hypothetical protein
LEVAKKAGYRGTSSTLSGEKKNVIRVKLEKASYDSIVKNKGFARGDIL